MPVSAVIFNSIPESFSFLLLALAVTNIPFKWKNLLLASVFSAFNSFIIRNLPIQFGIHIFLELPLLILIIKLCLRLKITHALLITLIGLTALGIIEYITMTLIVSLTGISINKALKNVYLRILFPLPEILILFTTGFYLHKKNIYILNLRQADK